MERVNAYRCQHCGKIYLRENACRKHEVSSCSQNPEIRPFCYSCTHYEASFDDNEIETIEYGLEYGWDGSEYTYTKRFSPNRCNHPDKNCKLYNNIKLSDEMRECLSEADYEPMPNRRSGGCSYYNRHSRTSIRNESMKCHYIVDKIAGRVLIPGCMAVAVSGDIEQCTCRDFDLSFSQFERKRYNEELKRRNDEIKNLQIENKYLMRELERHVELLKEYATEREKALEAKITKSKTLKRI